MKGKKKEKKYRRNRRLTERLKEERGRKREGEMSESNNILCSFTRTNGVSSNLSTSLNASSCLPLHDDGTINARDKMCSLSLSQFLFRTFDSTDRRTFTRIRKRERGIKKYFTSCCSLCKLEQLQSNIIMIIMT